LVMQCGHNQFNPLARALDFVTPGTYTVEPMRDDTSPRLKIKNRYRRTVVRLAHRTGASLQIYQSLWTRW
jgi:hypothetical protein